jgi:hypothetical protein
MGKRKADGSEGGLSVAPNRRSSRRKTGDEDGLVSSKENPTSNRAQKDKKPPKSVKDKPSKMETVKGKDTSESQVAHLFLWSYSHLEALFHILFSLYCQCLSHHVISYL